MSTLNIRFGGYQNPRSIHNQAAEYFGKILCEKLGDWVAFELVGNILNLGRKSEDLPGMVQSGELTCCYITTVQFAKSIPEIGILDLPFLIQDRSQIQRAFRGSFGEFLQERFAEDMPFKLLGIWDNGFRHITNKVRPIRTPADCQGLSIRTQISEVHVESLRAIGFEPIPVDVKVFVDEIAGPRFDAQDNPLTNSFNFGVHHYHRYFTQSGHFFGAAAFICNAKVFQGWPNEVQGIVVDAARVATEYQWQLASAEDEHVLAQIDPKENEIAYLSEAERALFQQAVKPVLEKYKKIISPRIFQMLLV